MEDLTNLGQKARNVYERVKWGDSHAPLYLSFEPSQIEGPDILSVPFEADEHYFQVRINEMFLAHTREYWTKFCPMVFAATQFVYDKDARVVPKVIGPDLLTQYRQELPVGMRYINTPVSGLHPYVGGEVVLILILYRAKCADALRSLLNIVEGVVGTFDPSTALRSYLAMADVILEGVEVILGTNQTKPVVAVRHSMGGMEQFKPGYYALIDVPETTISGGQFWVRGNRLFFGQSLETSEPYRENDFILFSILQQERRDDLRRLPFFPIWEQVQELAMRPESWTEAKFSFRTLWRELLFSPDLTKPQRGALKELFREELEYLRAEAVGLAEMSASIPRGGRELGTLEKELRELDTLLADLD